MHLKTHQRKEIKEKYNQIVVTHPSIQATGGDTTEKALPLGTDTLIVCDDALLFWRVSCRHLIPHKDANSR